MIRGNAGLLKCQWPSFVADHLTVESWLIDDKDVVTASHSQMHHGTFYKHLQKTTTPVHLLLLLLSSPDPTPTHAPSRIVDL